ncbi:MAG: DUF6531 domain-containing protein [Defluviitaleaceae bacterium]|nr:DUF6531 domain-containing protein [Defluviitaleaceae bacterium]
MKTKKRLELTLTATPPATLLNKLNPTIALLFGVRCYPKKTHIQHLTAYLLAFILLLSTLPPLQAHAEHEQATEPQTSERMELPDMQPYTLPELNLHLDMPSMPISVVLDTDSDLVYHSGIEIVGEPEISEPYTLGRSSYYYTDAIMHFYWHWWIEQDGVIIDRGITNYNTFTATYRVDYGVVAECLSADIEVGPVLSGRWIPAGVALIYNDYEPGWGLAYAQAVHGHPQVPQAEWGFISVFTGVSIYGDIHIQVRDERNGDNLNHWLRYSPWRYSDSSIDFTKFPRGLLDLDDIPFISENDGDPVHMVTGNFYTDYTDFSLHGAEPLNFTRHYNSRDTKFDELGRGWRHNYMYTLSVKSYDNTNMNTFVIQEPNGNIIEFDAIHGGFFPSRHTDKAFRQVGTGSERVYVMSDRAGNAYTFDSYGDLISIEDSIGNRTEISYYTLFNIKLFMSSISNRSGTLYFTYINGVISRIDDHTGRSVEYSYYPDGNLRSFTNTDGDTLEYEYENNRLTQITDFNGNIYLTNEYDSQGRAIKQYMLDQGTFDYVYDVNNRVTTITDGEGAVRQYFYDAIGQTVAIADEAGRIEYEYQNGHLVKTIDGLGNSVAFTHDNAGNRTSVSYFSHENETATPCEIELFEYNNRNLPTKHTQRDGSVVEFTYDTNGNMTSRTIIMPDNTDPLAPDYDPLAPIETQTYTFTYDTQNNLLTSTDPLGNTTNFTYDAVGNVLTQTDPLGNVTAFEYDNLGRLTKQTNPDDGKIDFTYSHAGKLLQTTDPLGGVYHFTVDGNGFNTAATDPLSNSTTITRNAQNKPTTTTDPRGNTTSHEYDLAGNLTKIINAQQNETTYTHDQRGRITSMTDPRGNTWTFTFDAENRMTSETDPLDNTTTFDYDLFGNLTHLTTPSGNTLASVFDGMGRRIKTIDPEANETTYHYDNASRLTRITNADNTYSELTYNSAGWLTSVKDETGAETSYEYNANGQLTQLTDPLGGVTAFAYDTMGRIIAETNAIGGVTSYTYDQNSNILTITDPMDGDSL